MTRKFCSRQIQKHSAAEFIHQLLAPISAQDALFWNTSFIRNIFRAGIGETLKCFFFYWCFSCPGPSNTATVLKTLRLKSDDELLSVLSIAR